MDSRNKQISPPKNWQEFESLCLALFKSIWNDPNAQKNGRGGQAQHGVDVVGIRDNQIGQYHGVQCKGKDGSYGGKVTEKELLEELAKADQFQPPLVHWILATTAPKDARIEEVARKLTATRALEGKFPVYVFGWGDIEEQLPDHPKVLRSFYPELGPDVNTIVDAFLYQNASRPGETGIHGESGEQFRRPWKRIEFGLSRDIGPALLGRPLGPADALACPKLPEVDRAIKQLDLAYSTRLVGEPGAGKSVCAYQVAHTFAERGFAIHAAAGASILSLDLPEMDECGAMLILDDAHLISEDDLYSLEQRAGSKYLVLSVHNAIEGVTSQRGAIRMNPKEAIQAIAAGLLENRQTTLEVVRRADSQIGDSMMGQALEERIEHAAKYASVPWQFCFVLGGGWRRVKDAMAAIESLQADLQLAAISIRQLASRDAQADLDQIANLLAAANIDSGSQVEKILGLINQRLILSIDDLRCPHQQFAAVLLDKLIQRQTEAGRKAIAVMLSAVLSDATLPLAGLRVLLHELHFGNSGMWRVLVNEAALRPAIHRCWEARSPADVMAACFLLSETIAYLSNWEAAALQGCEHILLEWISNPSAPMGYGLSHLLNSMLNRNRDATVTLIRKIEPSMIATIISNVNTETAWHVSSLVTTLRLDYEDAWSTSVLSGLDRRRLIDFAAGWPDSESLHQVTGLLNTLIHRDQALTLDMLDAMLPTIKRQLIANPVEEFHYISEIAWHVLRVLDIFGIYKGKLASSARQRRTAREMFVGVDLPDLAAKLSLAPLRDLQTVSYLIAFLREVSLSKYRKLISFLDWRTVGTTIGEYWAHLPHEAAVLLAVSAGDKETHPVIHEVIRQNADRMRVMPARLAIIAPDIAVDFVRRGKQVGIADFDHIEWRLAPHLIRYFAEHDAALIGTLLDQCIPTLSKCFSQPNESWYKECSPTLEAILEFSPDTLQKAFDGVDVKTAKSGWQAAWAAGKSEKATATLLVRAALKRDDGVGKIAVHLAKEFRLRPET